MFDQTFIVMEATIYLTVKIVCAIFIFYHLWIFIFGKKVFGVWDKLYRWARIARVKLWSYRKRCSEKKARNARRKAILGKKLPTKQTPQAVEKQQPVVLDTNVEKTVTEPMEKKVEMLQTPVDEDDVIGKTNIIYLEDPEVARKTPIRSEPLTKEPIEEDEEINPDDVAHESKGLTVEERTELMAPVECEPDPDFDTALTFEEISNVADVLVSDNSDEGKRMRAAETIHHKLSSSDILTFLTDKLSNQNKVDRLLSEYLSGNGNPISNQKTVQKEKKPFDIKKYT